MKYLKITFKKLSSNFQNYKFAIKTVIKGGEISNWPMVKAPGLFSQWRPLVKVEHEVQVMDYEIPYGLPVEECYSRIETFKEQLSIQADRSITSIEIQEITDQEIATRHDMYCDIDKW